MGSVRCIAGSFLRDALDHRDGVLAHRAADVELHRRRAAHPRPPTVGRSERVLGVADVGDADRRAVLRRDDDVVEVLGGVDAAERAQQQLALALLDRAARNLDVLVRPPRRGTWSIDSP